MSGVTTAGYDAGGMQSTRFDPSTSQSQQQQYQYLTVDRSNATNQYDRPPAAAAPHQVSVPYAGCLSTLAQHQTNGEHYQPIDKPKRQYGGALSPQAQHFQLHHYEEAGALQNLN
eukprot:TRINITY_DN379_c0_g1_i2.p2 TRINITY_DN379_c0_g1~~TRINITY_DN379_c0_g1_i2.p2  ORF type:complete len:115 (-),score=6.78 TRINITY_DN379_c0_g1_i2:97-441(-)